MRPHICPIETAIIRSPLGRLLKHKLGDSFSVSVTRDYKNKFKLVAKISGQTFDISEIDYVATMFDCYATQGNIEKLVNLCPISFDIKT